MPGERFRARRRDGPMNAHDAHGDPSEVVAEQGD
jgi:hypothetical protein